MQAYIDESGDTGTKFDCNSSRYFVLSLIIFKNEYEANACDQAISKLRAQLSLPSNYEFHFAHNRAEIRHHFINCINKFDFWYYVVVVDKHQLLKTNRQVLSSKLSCFQFAYDLILTLAQDNLSAGTLIADDNGDRNFNRNMRKHLRTGISSQQVKLFKTQDSRKNNLLQIADYIASLYHRQTLGKKESNKLLRLLRGRQAKVLHYPPSPF